MHRIMLISAAACAAFTPLALGMGNPYEIEAIAFAVNTPGEQDVSTTSDYVAAVAHGESEPPQGPSTGDSYARGGPDDVTCWASTDAMFDGRASFGSADALFVVRDDQINFAASGPFRVRVTVTIEAETQSLTFADLTQILVESTFGVRPVGGFTLRETADFSYIEQSVGGISFVHLDITDPIEFDMVPGESLVLSFQRVQVHAVANGSNGLPDGSALGMLRAAHTIEVIEGDASITGTSSGADYNLPACSVADFAAPTGEQNIDDLLAFLSAFNAGDPRADIAPDFGTLNIDDILAFLSAFDAGCP